MSEFIYAILGAGRQGTAAAYDLAKFGQAKKILLADIDQNNAEQAAKRINRLIGRPVAEAVALRIGELRCFRRRCRRIGSSGT